eukprot:CAMPEP_0117661184 /NCGR_PEP_ID=MMETSP0804-20121206/7405_1 /TAXON_ID=1074897 /ORGANISM="Tetraselmis astigmatica, Strain CCMP880" /LENGTH=587 /DNA_ID=CAMNT_0005468041 /DNA_START=310 /DNA_END=2073 /DNA_ORIENTATION=-
MCVFTLGGRSLREALDAANTEPLSWLQRVSVLIGVASGLVYLHEVASPPVAHCDVSARNILLMRDHSACLADFGLATDLPQAGQGCVSVSEVRSTFGYIAPEVASKGAISAKADVYSFGVLMLEVLTGQLPVDTSRKQGEQHLAEWLLPLLGDANAMLAKLDPRMPGGLASCPIPHLALLCEVAAACLAHEPRERLRARDAVDQLRAIQEASTSSSRGSAAQHNASSGSTSGRDVRLRNRAAAAGAAPARGRPSARAPAPAPSSSQAPQAPCSASISTPAAPQPPSNSVFDPFDPQGVFNNPFLPVSPREGEEGEGQARAPAPPTSGLGEPSSTAKALRHVELGSRWDTSPPWWHISGNPFLEPVPFPAQPLGLHVDESTAAAPSAGSAGLSGSPQVINSFVDVPQEGCWQQPAKRDEEVLVGAWNPFQDPSPSPRAASSAHPQPQQPIAWENSFEDVEGQGGHTCPPWESPLPPAHVPSAEGGLRDPSTPRSLDTLCLLCFSEVRDQRLEPCGHVAVCRCCGPVLRSVVGPCPVCSAPVAATSLHQQQKAPSALKKGWPLGNNAGGAELAVSRAQTHYNPHVTGVA